MKKFSIALSICCIVLIAFIVCSKTIQKQEEDLSSRILKANIEALAQGESGYSCSASANCYDLDGKEIGNVSCNGTDKCISGYQFVQCDGHKNSCY